VVQLAGETGGFPTGLYAGVVAHPQPLAGDPQSKKPFSWAFGNHTLSEQNPSEIASVTPASLAIRVFDTQGESLGMIANTTPGGPCNLQGGPYGEDEFYGSFVALAPGRDGELFALVQADLGEKEEPFTLAPASPLAKTIVEPLTHVQGDEVVRFAPGAGQNSAQGEACPQPTGGFSITNVTTGSTPSTGSGAITVPLNTKLKLESEGNLQGGTPWAYEWQSGDGASSTSKWIAENRWAWPSPEVEFTYAKEGSYTAKLNLVNDFGSLAAQRTVNVVKAVPPTACFSAPNGTVGQFVKFDASCSKAPQFDSIASYHWSFGDGHGETSSSPLTEHKYSAGGTPTVTLTVTDALGQEATASKAVSVTGESKTTPPPTTTPTTTPPTTTPPPPPPPIQVINTSPTEVSPKVASTASVHGTVAVKVSCPASKPSCSGTITLKTIGAGKSSHGKHSTAVVLGRASFGLKSGQSTTVQLRLSRSGLALLRAKHSLKVIATIMATDPGGHAKTNTETITLRAPVQGHKKH
jgi:PKD repeat protein